VKDLDFGHLQILVRDAKGAKDRQTILPAILVGSLQAHLRRIRKQHETDLRRGLSAVALPEALDRKYRAAGREWMWQYVFPGSRSHRGTSADAPNRYPLHRSVIQRAGGMVEGSRLRIICLDLDRRDSPCLVFPLAMRNAERIKLSGKEEGA
jgi:hypothetical protein